MSQLSFQKRAILALAPGLIAFLLKILVWSWRVKEENGEGISPYQKGGNRFIYAFWHDQIIAGVGLFKGSDVPSMASQSFDGDLIARALVKLGYPAPARGSTSRGGQGALKALADVLRSGQSVVLTPDGPRGPRHRAQSGVVALARLTGTPVLPVAFHLRPVLRLKGWDRMQIPWPFARGQIVFGNPFDCDPAESDSQQLERFQNELERVNQRARSLLENAAT
jgi:lysophospholipid acyltransferase (LPLAT)-like uncharacterized protein